MDSEPKVNSDPRRILPSVDRLIRQVAARFPELAPWAVRRAAKDSVERIRTKISQGDSAFAGSPADLEALIESVRISAERFGAGHPQRVINATGVLLHTNLGRAPVAAAVAAAVGRALDGYSNLELDLETGRRGSRMGSLEAKLLALSGAEAAHVVNNNAAAVLLALNTLALGREVIVSRGELVEIGGSFRVPSIMERAGVALAEIGTTNRTHLADYENAIGPETGLLLKVHRSNFEQRGFIAEADVREIAELARARGLPFLEDLGSGTLLDLGAAGLPDEAFAPARLALGIDVICFSGDKLLGGPQAGILLGRREHIEAMKKNPLARALRVDKMTVAALDATLDLMLDEARANEVPVIAGLRASASDLVPRAERLLERVTPIVEGRGKARIAASEAAVGGGSLPEHRLPGWAVVVEGIAVDRVAARMREPVGRVAQTADGAGDRLPVLVRVRDDALWLDVRTLREDELARVADALSRALEVA